MPTKKLILRKEHFGGLFVDTTSEETLFLKPEEYDSKKQELLEAKKQGERVKLFDATKRGFPLLQNAASSPMDIYFELTKSCNSLCTHCFIDSNSSKLSSQEVSFSEIKPIIKQFSDVGGFYIRLTGGEPTIRGDFFDIVDLINDEGIVIGLNTNGLFGEKKLEGILSRGIKDVRVSLDGLKEVNDTIRGEGTYRQITQTLENIAEYNKTANEPTQLTINVVLMKSNMGNIEEMIELAQNYDSKISFGLLRLTGRAQKEEMLSPEEVVLSTYKIHEARRRLGLSQSNVRINYNILCEDSGKKEFTPYPFDNSKCPIGSNGITLDAYARIVPCGYLVNVDNDRWIGEDVRGKDLLDLWYNSQVLNEVRRITRPGCNDCDYHIVKCNGGCPVMAYVFEGNIDGKDPYCVRDIKIPKIIKSISK
ncbi:MAG: radical SAM protein [archaeon]